MSGPQYEARDGASFPIGTPRWCDNSGEPVLISDLAGISRNDIDSSDQSLWRYRAAFPIDVADPITMGEGRTPLVARSFGNNTALCKLEWFSPTGSFKDRGASVMLSILRSQGIDAVLEDSSGNGGAAIAAYAKAGGMRAKILVPESTQPAKTVQMRAYGAEVELIPGTRQDTADAALAQSAEFFYASHNWQAFFIHGTKTLGYELWEDLGFVAPDNVIIPTGAGSNVLGLDLAFNELLRAGQIDRLPRLFAAQPTNCSPIHASFTRGLVEVEVIDTSPTIAGGTAISQPVRGREVLAALKRSNGGTCAIDEDMIMQAHGELAGVGMYVEPTSAMALAAFRQLVAAGTIRDGETTVLVLTGSGLKATQTIGEMMGALDPA